MNHTELTALVNKLFWTFPAPATVEVLVRKYGIDRAVAKKVVAEVLATLKRP